MRFNSDICVGWFAIDARGDGAVVLTCEEDVEEGDGLAHFLLSRELDTRMDRVETLIECNHGVLACAGSQAGTAMVHEHPTVIHVDEGKARCRVAFFPGNLLILSVP